ncbi:MAG: hypothetical protein H0W02_00620 [Ktedonobacteraceae bacterium]|nr:hypothetical protein [Ktedonobacteraceae bacterium]
MSTDISVTVAPAQKKPITQRSTLRFSPLWLCLLLAFALRIWLIIHTHGVIDGDEAMVGIQAQRILHGEFPVYFYGQPYMGSLEAYLVAALFAVFGISVWAMRLEAALLSLVLVWVTWRFAGALAEAAHLSQPARQRFMTVAGLCAAIVPLYDGVLELHMLGGYIETFFLMLLLLLSSFQLARRWFSDANQGEMAWRWAGIGFIVGLGLWINPLILSAIVAATLWILGSFLLQWRRRGTAMPIVRQLLLLPLAVFTAVIGMAPALVWGATNQWANVTYVFSLSGHETLRMRFMSALNVAQSFESCITPRLIGGALPQENSALLGLHKALFILGLGAIILALGMCFLPTTQGATIRRLIGLPALFAGVATGIFCTSAVGGFEVLYGCTNDFSGRYATPVSLALPFFFAAVFVLLWQAIHSPHASRWLHQRLAHSLLALTLVLSLAAQALPYAFTSAGETYQSNYCIFDPWDNTPILNYLEQQHIHFLWAHNMLAYPLVFKSHLTIIGADPVPVQHPGLAVNRLPAYTQAVLHANRASMLFIIPHDDVQPHIFQALAALHVTYHAARFYSQPGYDVLVVTPLNRSVSPLESPQLDLFQCVSS